MPQTVSFRAEAVWCPHYGNARSKENRKRKKNRITTSQIYKGKYHFK